MKGEVVNLNRERWLALANLAFAAGHSLAEADVTALSSQAAKMQAAPPTATDGRRMTACLMFRWQCQHFGLAEAAERRVLAEALLNHAAYLRRLFDYRSPGPDALALSQPAPSPTPLLDAPPEPAWLKRADIAG